MQIDSKRVEVTSQQNFPQNLRRPANANSPLPRFARGCLTFVDGVPGKHAWDRFLRRHDLIFYPGKGAIAPESLIPHKKGTRRGVVPGPYEEIPSDRPHGILCRDLCRNPPIPTRVGCYLVLSLGYR
jgi:hypothetical protein